jgi:hypothetical protein
MMTMCSLTPCSQVEHRGMFVPYVFRNEACDVGEAAFGMDQVGFVNELNIVVD